MTGLKVHLRACGIGAVTYRVVTLRPATRVRFSTNYFHDTWHVLTGREGAVVLAHLLWGLAFQRQPGTLLLLDAPHVVATPFEGDPADPIAVVPAGLTSIDGDGLRLLRRRLRGVATTTIRWHTFGMARALEVEDRRSWREREATRHREKMSRRGGFVCYTAAPETLRETALGVHRAHPSPYGTYLPLAEYDEPGRWGYDGEVQVFSDFDERVAAAAVARCEVVGDRAIASEAEREAVYVRARDVAARRLGARRAASSGTRPSRRARGGPG